MVTKSIFTALILLIIVALAACSSGGANPAPAAPQNSAPAPATTPTATPAMPENIPIMPGATDLTFSESDIAYMVKSDLNQVIDFYSKEMPAKGWKEQEKPSVIGILGRMNFSSPTHQVSFFLTFSEVLKQVQVRMTIFGMNVANPTVKP